MSAERIALNKKIINCNKCSRLIKFTAHGMKPSTKVYPYFDDEQVSGFTTPTNSAFPGKWSCEPLVGKGEFDE